MFVHARSAKSKTSMLEDLARLKVVPVSSKLAARNTIDYTLADGTRKIRLHDTDIMTFLPDGRIELNTGGFNTKTTRERMNSFLPRGFNVFTQKGVIHARTPWDTVKFRETVTIDPAKQVVKSDLSEKAADKLERLISDYMKTYKQKGLPTVEESGGDPWVFPDNQTGKIEQHIVMDWLKTKYVHRRFMALALQFSGLRDVGIYLTMQSIDRRDGKIDATDSRRLRRYIRACVGLES